MYSLMTVRELHAELRKRNASVAGKKAALIQRLEAYDRNQNFDENLDVEVDRLYVYPPSNTFKDINADSQIPNITRHEIQEYFERFNTHPKGQLLYEARHLVTARYASDDAFTYLKGQCKASMKKLVYMVDIKVSQEGAIEECHCECAAGSGTAASCKHVAVLLLAAHEIANNKTIKLHQACTQQLMTFKQPRKIFYNSPIAARNLPSKRVYSSNFDPLKESDIMENYTEYVRNMAIGYGESSMPILQTYEPANPHGLEWDHSYTKTDLKDRILNALHLKNVSVEQIKYIEEKTQAQHASPEWHELRKCRITASMFYAVSHCTNTGKSALLKKIINPRPIHTRATTHGKVHEPIVIQKYENEYGMKVQQSGIFISKDFPFLAASPDGLLEDDTVVEVKAPYSSRYCFINETTVPYLKNENNELQLKRQHPYYAQVQGQLFCTGRQYANFIVYTFKDMKVIYITRNDEYINEMLTALINFYLHDLEPAVLDKYMYKDYLSLIKRQ